MNICKERRVKNPSPIRQKILRMLIAYYCVGVPLSAIVPCLGEPKLSAFEIIDIVKGGIIFGSVFILPGVIYLLLEKR